MRTRASIVSLIVITALLASACSVLPSISTVSRLLQNPPATPQVQPTQPAAPSAPTQAAQAPAAQVPISGGNSAGLLAAMQGTLENIYTQVNPSVVNIEVSSTVTTQQSFPQLPFGFQNPFSNPNGNQPNGNGRSQVQKALGSGFVWDNNGHIVTNNHVVDGSDTITVTFSDGRQMSAKVVGTDPDSDLAVIQVENGGPMAPLQLTNSDQVKVGELAVAIGNPFGLSGTMTVGYVSALGRTLPSDSNTNSNSTSTSPTYTIPDVIQTDASINPGNSGGVLLNDQGQVIGVTSAIESSTRSNSGIGFVIPSNIVEKVVPELIKNGKFEHAYIGISGTDMSMQIAKAMNLDPGQRGALVVDVSSGGPADQAGIKGSTQQVQIDGATAQVGGDVIVSAGDQKINQFDDLVSYLFKNTSIGQTLKLGIIRGGKSQMVNVVLAARPSSTQPTQTNQRNNNPQPSNSRIMLGITGINLDSTLNQAMKLDQNQQGVLVLGVVKNGPADQAGIVGGTTPFTYQGQQINIGGDVITGVDGKTISNMQSLRNALSGSKPGDKVSVTVLRNGKTTNFDVTVSGVSGG